MAFSFGILNIKSVKVEMNMKTTLKIATKEMIIITV